MTAALLSVAPLSAQPPAGIELEIEDGEPSLADEVFVPREGPQDPRFFGTYCNTRTERLCEKVAFEFLGIGVGEKTVCADVDEIRVALDHYRTVERTSRGLLRGTGFVRAEGNWIGLCYSGQVTATGRATANGSVPGGGSRAADLELSANGRMLTIRSEGKEFELRKDACGNSEPEVAPLSPVDGAVLNRACPVRFRASYSDDLDNTIPAGRARFQSHVDGVLQGVTSESPGLFTLEASGLSLGQHAITFLATDSGGLENGRTVTVEVQNFPHGLCLPDVGGIAIETDPPGGSS